MDKTNEDFEREQEVIDKKVLSLYNKDTKLYNSIFEKLGEQESVGIQGYVFHKGVDISNDDWDKIDVEYYKLNGYTINKDIDTMEISW